MQTIGLNRGKCNYDFSASVSCCTFFISFLHIPDSVPKLFVPYFDFNSGIGRCLLVGFKWCSIDGGMSSMLMGWR